MTTPARPLTHKRSLNAPDREEAEAEEDDRRWAELQATAESGPDAAKEKPSPRKWAKGYIILARQIFLVTD